MIPVSASATFEAVGKLEHLGRVDLGRLATYEDVRDTPDHVVAELIDGALYTQARPRPRNADFMLGLGARLRDAFDDRLGLPERWRILAEPELHLDGRVLVPDLAGWRSNRYPSGHADVVGIEVAPDWVCEIVSPSTAAKDRVLKLPRYGEAGVAWAWIVDPRARSIEVYKSDGGLWTLLRAVLDAELIALEPFESLELPLASLWYTDPASQDDEG